MYQHGYSISAFYWQNWHRGPVLLTWFRTQRFLLCFAEHASVSATGQDTARRPPPNRQPATRPAQSEAPREVSRGPSAGPQGQTTDQPGAQLSRAGTGRQDTSRKLMATASQVSPKKSSGQTKPANTLAHGDTFWGDYNTEVAVSRAAASGRSTGGTRETDSRDVRTRPAMSEGQGGSRGKGRGSKKAQEQNPPLGAIRGLPAMEWDSWDEESSPVEPSASPTRSRSRSKDHSAQRPAEGARVGPAPSYEEQIKESMMSKSKGSAQRESRSRVLTVPRRQGVGGLAASPELTSASQQTQGRQRGSTELTPVVQQGDWASHQADREPIKRTNRTTVAVPTNRPHTDKARGAISSSGASAQSAAGDRTASERVKGASTAIAAAAAAAAGTHATSPVKIPPGLDTGVAITAGGTSMGAGQGAATSQKDGMNTSGKVCVIQMLAFLIQSRWGACWYRAGIINEVVRKKEEEIVLMTDLRLLLYWQVVGVINC